MGRYPNQDASAGQHPVPLLFHFPIGDELRPASLPEVLATTGATRRRQFGLARDSGPDGRRRAERGINWRVFQSVGGRTSETRTRACVLGRGVRVQNRWKRTRGFSRPMKRWAGEKAFWCCMLGIGICAMGRRSGLWDGRDETSRREIWCGHFLQPPAPASALNHDARARGSVGRFVSWRPADDVGPPGATDLRPGMCFQLKSGGRWDGVERSMVRRLFPF